MTAALAAVWLAGCGSGGEPSDTVITTEPAPAATDPIEPSEWDWQPDDTSDDAIDLAAAGNALDAAIVEVLSFDGRPVVDAYNAMFFGGRSLECPDATDDGFGGLYWNDYCSSTDGTYFGGYLFHYGYEDTYDGDLYLNGDTISGVVTVIDPVGTILDFEGDASWIEGVSEDGSLLVLSSFVSGGFAYEGQGATGWLTQGPKAVTVALTGIRVPSMDGTVVIVDGSANPRVDGETWSAMFYGNTVGDEVIGSACELEPGGIIDLRDPSGRWLEITFHGPILDLEVGDPARCDGCGDAVLNGEPVGEVCADFTPWMTWEALP